MLKNKVLMLVGWLPVDLYMQTRHWRLYALDDYVEEYYYGMTTAH